MSSETSCVDGTFGEKTLVFRFRNWMASPERLPLEPMLITAWLDRALMATPQFWQLPPEKLADRRTNW